MQYQKLLGLMALGTIMLGTGCRTESQFENSKRIEGYSASYLIGLEKGDFDVIHILSVTPLLADRKVARKNNLSEIRVMKSPTSELQVEVFVIAKDEATFGKFVDELHDASTVNGSTLNVFVSKNWYDCGQGKSDLCIDRVEVRLPNTENARVLINGALIH